MTNHLLEADLRRLELTAGWTSAQVAAYDTAGARPMPDPRGSSEPRPSGLARDRLWVEIDPAARPVSDI